VTPTIVECVPNFSEGRDAAKVDAIVEAIRSVGDIAVLDCSMDADHNRSVVTFAGPVEHIGEAAFRAVAKAVELIDLTRHEGVHPRIGAADVVPFVPVQGVTLSGCVRIAEQLGARVWEQLRVPVYLYEAAARRPERTRLEDVRRGQFEALREAVRTDPGRVPDFGAPELHPTAGAVVIGARKFLIAYNVRLNTPEVEIARRIARAIRASSGGMPYVKAMGVMLASRNQAQVSVNLTDFEITGLHEVFEAVRTEALRYGVAVVASEIVGLVPRRALELAAAHALKIESLESRAVFEERLASEIEWK
jgi:glutamate formiminotransferase